MAGKFKIFCDDRSSFEPEDKPILSTQQQQASQQPYQQVLQPTKTTDLDQQNLKREPLGLRQTTSQASAQLIEVPTATVTSSLSVNEEDQENDISMASLGSDFVPSILHDDDYDEYSFDNEEEEDLAEIVDDDDQFDLDDDEELRLELSRAFKQHDDSQLFKSTVYIDDIKSYLYELEREPELRALPNYMDFQADIDSDKRAILFNWLVEVCDEYRLDTETLFICTNIIDRFLSKMSITTTNFQLLGAAAMFIATKYEEIISPTLNEFVEMTDHSCTGQQICQMEQEILTTLNFRISLPSISFFVRQIFAYNKFPKKVYHLADYLCHLSLLADQPFLEYYPSEIALAAVILAAHQLDAAANISPQLKEAYDESNIDQLKRRNLPEGVKLREIDRRVYVIQEDLPFCVEALRTMQEKAYRQNSDDSSEQGVVSKFSSDSYSAVAKIKPPRDEDLYSY